MKNCEYETPAEVPETAGKAPAGETEEGNPDEVGVSSELAELTLKKDEHIARMIENLKDWSPQLSPERRRGRAIQSFICEYPNQEWYKVLTSEEWRIVSDMVKATGEDTFLQRLRDGWVLGHSGQDKQITSDNQEGGTPPETPEPEE